MLSRYISISGGGGQPKNMKAKASRSHKMKSVSCPYASSTKFFLSPHFRPSHLQMHGQ